MTLTDWAALLLADCSSNNLLVFSDWLELDQDDEELAQAARGVRELLVKEGKRPDYYGPQPIKGEDTEFLWQSRYHDQDFSHQSILPRNVFLELKQIRGTTVFGAWYWGGRNPDDIALAHLTALLDAAQAWAKCNPEPLTKGKVTT